MIRRDRRGATASDLLVFLATVSLGAALLYPAWSARGFRDLVERAGTDVETLASAARSSLQATGSWPTPAAPGEIPPELAGPSSEDESLARSQYRVTWTSWNVVDSIDVEVDVVFAPGDAPPDSVGPLREPVVRTIGGIVIHSRNAGLLAELALRFGDEPSFVLDSMWVLVLPERAVTRRPGP